MGPALSPDARRAGAWGVLALVGTALVLLVPDYTVMGSVMSGAGVGYVASFAVGELRRRRRR